MGRLTKNLLDTLAQFLPTLEKLEPGTAALAFRDEHGRFEQKYIEYVFQNHSSYYGEGISVFDGHAYLVTVPIELIKEWKDLKAKPNSKES